MLILGIEIGGTKLQAVLGQMDGTFVYTERGSVNPARGAAGVLEWMEEHIPQVILKAKEFDEEVSGIGIGFGGPVDESAGRIIQSMQVEGWKDFELKKWCEEKFGLPSFVYNDSSAACWGEYCLGSGKGTKNFFYTNIGSGIGGGLVIEGKLYNGQGYGAGELGQTYIPDVTVKEAGKEQKLEKLCSGWAIEKRLRASEEVKNSKILMELCGGDPQKLTCAMLGKAVKEKDAFAAAFLDNVTESIGIAISNVVSLFGPEVIAIGGGVSLIGDEFIDRIRRSVEKHEFVSSHGHYRVCRCSLNEEIVPAGAIKLAEQDLKKNI